MSNDIVAQYEFPSPDEFPRGAIDGTLYELRGMHYVCYNNLWHMVVTMSPAERKLAHAIETLEKLACLGNGDEYGNSVGNEMAQVALKRIHEIE